MKKFFTLIAAVLLSSGAFAQKEFVDLVVNGNMEGEQDAKWSSFWCHDWRRGLGDFDPESGQRYDNDDPDNGQFQGFAEIIVDPLDPNNHCARVIARSEAEADEAGNKVAANGALASWDCQFFVYATDTIPEGKELRMTLKVRAEKDGMFETQAHWAPGDYNYYQLFGNINVTTEWQKVTVTAIIDGNHTQGASDKRMQSVAFNLSTNAEGNVFYFDDVKLEMRDQPDPNPFAGWFNMLRHGTLSTDKIGNYTNFTGRMGIDNTDRQAIVVNDPLDGEPALTVTSIAFNHQEVNKKEVLDEEGNPVLDENGDPTFEEEVVNYYLNDETGERLDNIDDWRTQFFVTGPHKFAANSKFRLKMWARADKECTIQSQVHRMPGDYIFYVGVGDLALTPEWKLFEFDDQTVSNDQSGTGTMQTIAFNCNTKKDEPVTFYFRFEDFSANLGDMTNAERVLESETVMLPVPEPDNKDGAVGTINFDNCLQVLESNSFENLIGENMSVVNGDDTYKEVDASAGFYIADNGWLSEEETPLTFEFEEVSNDDPNLKVTIYNDGESFADKKIDTQFRYEFADWFYLFNVSLVPEETYTGVAELKAQPAKQNAIYDLSGRRVEKAVKGLYIINGKKYLVK
ncbi:MAG: hypothetical protein K6D37_11310 [Prevotella sp.]|nr:hypothetical protein [Prevotella sp.]